MKANTFKSKKAKGIRLENKIAQMIRLKGLDANAKKMPRSGAFDGFKSDVYTTIPLTIEAKNTEKHDWWGEWEQAKNQEKPLKPACLVVSGNYRPILAIVELDVMLNMLLEIKELKELLEKD